jgi:DNA-directed RNA polymerase specialized sigma24 family protein
MTPTVEELTITKRQDLFAGCIKFIRQQFHKHFYGRGVPQDLYDDIFQDLLLLCWRKFQGYCPEKGKPTTYLHFAASRGTLEVLRIRSQKKWDRDRRVTFDEKKIIDHRSQLDDEIRERAIAEGLKSAGELLGREMIETLDWLENHAEYGVEPPAHYDANARPGSIAKQRWRYRLAARYLAGKSHLSRP